jgi:hypothetical protein
MIDGLDSDMFTQNIFKHFVITLYQRSTKIKLIFHSTFSERFIPPTFSELLKSMKLILDAVQPQLRSWGYGKRQARYYRSLWQHIPSEVCTYILAWSGIRGESFIAHGLRKDLRGEMKLSILLFKALCN